MTKGMAMTHCNRSHRTAIVSATLVLLAFAAPPASLATPPIFGTPKSFSILRTQATADVKLGWASKVRGNVCGRTVTMVDRSHVRGSIIATESSGPAASLGPLAGVTVDVITAGGSVQVDPAATVGGQIEDASVLGNYGVCIQAGEIAAADLDTFRALPESAGGALGVITVGQGQRRRIPRFGSFGPGQAVLDATSIDLGQHAALLIAVKPGTDMILRVSGSLHGDYASNIRLLGASPKHALLIVGGSVTMEPHARIRASIDAAGPITMRRNSVLNGSLIAGGTVFLDLRASILLYPFEGWSQ